MNASRTIILMVLISTLALAACSDQTQDLPYQTTPEPGTPDFSQPTISDINPDYPYPEPAAMPTVDPSYPAPPTPQPENNAYPEPAATPSGTRDGRSETALESYSIALDWAKQNFNPDPQFYGVVPSHIMIANLGSPPITEGWFYKFQAEGTSAHYYVQVIDGEISGGREITPLGEITPIELPFAVENITVDSDQLFELFREFATRQGIDIQESLIYDLELVFIEGTAGPIWSVVTPDGSQWLYSINAVTGEETNNPRQ